MSKELIQHLENMKASSLAMAKALPSIVENSFKKMSKEDGEKFKAQLKDSGVLEQVKQNIEKIKEMNKEKYE